MGISRLEWNTNPAILNTHDLGCGIGLLRTGLRNLEPRYELESKQHTSCFSNAALRDFQEEPQSRSSALVRRARKMETFTCERRVLFGGLLQIGILIYEGKAGDPRFGTWTEQQVPQTIPGTAGPNNSPKAYRLKIALKEAVSLGGSP
jgi:hypothetical protein